MIVHTVINAYLFAPQLPPLSGVLTRKNANQSVGTSFVALTWQEEVYDSGAFHDNSSNTDRHTVPSGLGIEAVRISTGVRYAGAVTPTLRHMKSTGGGAVATFTGRGQYRNESSSGTDLGYTLLNAVSAIVEVSDAESAYFVSEYSQTSGSNNIGDNGNSYMATEVIDPSLLRVLAYKTSTQAIAANVPEEATWDATEYNIGSWTVSAENITVPFTGRVRLSCNISVGNVSGQLSVRFYVNGASIPGATYKACDVNGTDISNAASAALEVSSGDELSVEVTHGSATDISTASWFCVEEVPSDYVCVLLHRNSGTQSLTAATDIPIEWQVAAYEDDAALWDAGAPTVVVAPFDGYFRQTFGLIGSSAANQTAVWGEQEASIYYGSPGSTVATGSTIHTGAMGAWAPCLAGDEIRLVARSVTTRTIGTDDGMFMGVEFRAV